MSESLREAGAPRFAADPRAACKEADPTVFFPHTGQSDAAAKAYCAVCPLIDECREYAVPIPDLSGIWGGTNQRERDRIRWNRRAESCICGPMPAADGYVYGCPTHDPGGQR